MQPSRANIINITNDGHRMAAGHSMAAILGGRPAAARGKNGLGTAIRNIGVSNGKVTYVSKIYYSNR